MIYKFIDKKTSGAAVKNENMTNQCPLDLAIIRIQNYNKAIIRTFEE